MGKYGVTCNSIRPRAGTRLTLTDELRAAMEKKRAAGIGSVGTSLELTELQPEDIAPFVIFLALDEAANINGYDFVVGGGIIGVFSQPEIIKTNYKKGRWTIDELVELVPETLAKDLVNPVTPAQ